MRDAWQDYFQPGEKLLWEGAPKPGVYEKAKIIGLAIFGFPFLVIGVGTLIAGLGSMLTAKGWGDIWHGVFLAAFSLPFAAAGAVMVVGQWYAAHTAHRKTRYALSTRAAYVATAYWKQSLTVFPIGPDQPLELQKGQSADTVWFHKREWRDSDGDTRKSQAGFENIVDGDKVFHLIRGISQGTKGGIV